VKALDLLIKQLEENYENRTDMPFWAGLFGFDDNKKFHKYYIEKIEAFHDAIDELRDFLTEYEKLKEDAKYIQNSAFFEKSQEIDDDYYYIPYRTLRIRVKVASILEEIKKLQQEIKFIYQAIHKKQTGEIK